MTEKECVVCNRIPASTVFKLAHEILDFNVGGHDRSHNTLNCDKNQIHFFAQKAVTIINTVDQADRLFFCGRTQGFILSGLFYLLSIEQGLSVSQERIGRKCSKTIKEHSFYGEAGNIVRRSYHRWLQRHPELFPDLSEKLSVAKQAETNRRVFPFLDSTFSGNKQNLPS